MAWNLIAPNTWSNSKSPYIVKFDSITSSFIVEDIDGKNSIPFDDIFNNPAFVPDFGNNPVIGKHFRAEAANTPGTPGFSFQDDINTGFFRISSGVVGFASNGVLIATFDSNGIAANITPQYWNIVDSKASGTGGGVFSSGSWRTRDLNTTLGTNSISGSSLASNQFTLPAGTYRIFASAPTYAVNKHKTRLRNITDSVDTLLGTSEHSDQTYNGATRSFIAGIFTISSQKTFEIQHQCQTTQNFGQASSFGVNEIYTVVELWKLV